MIDGCPGISLPGVQVSPNYEVPTERLNEQVKRNLDRFPEDFLFRLTRTEVEALNRSQSATGSQKHRDPRFAPYAFTEHAYSTAHARSR